MHYTLSIKNINGKNSIFNMLIGFDSCLDISAVNSSYMKKLAIKATFHKVKTKQKVRLKGSLSINNSQAKEPFLLQIWLGKNKQNVTNFFYT
jgi:hypothetical protein